MELTLSILIACLPQGRAVTDLERQVRSVLPRPEEERWLRIPCA